MSNDQYKQMDDTTVILAIAAVFSAFFMVAYWFLA